MGIYDKIVMKSVSRRTMTIFFLIDTSTSMRGIKIDEVNRAMNEILPEIQNISQTNADASIKIAVLTYSTGARWITKPVPVEEYIWIPLKAGGRTNFRTGLDFTEELLKSPEFASEKCGAFAPAFILIADGGSDEPYKNKMKILSEISWFKYGMKIAIAIGNEVHQDMLERFTGSPETVIRVHNASQLRKLIRFVSVKASQIGSQSAANTGTNIDQIKTKQSVIAEAIQNNIVISSDDDYNDW